MLRVRFGASLWTRATPACEAHLAMAVERVEAVENPPPNRGCRSRLRLRLGLNHMRPLPKPLRLGVAALLNIGPPRGGRFAPGPHTMIQTRSDPEQHGTRGYSHGAERPPRFAGEGRIER